MIGGIVTRKTKELKKKIKLSTSNTKGKTMLIKMLLTGSLLLTCLNGCKHHTQISKEDKKLEVITEECDVEFEFNKHGDIITDRSVCWCKDIKMSLNGVFTVSTDRPMKIGYCHKITGYSRFNEIEAFREKLWRAIRRNIGL